MAGGLTGGAALPLHCWVRYPGTNNQTSDLYKVACHIEVIYPQKISQSETLPCFNLVCLETTNPIGMTN